MTQKNAEKTKARALQERTGWTYQECLLRVRTLTPEALDILIKVRAGSA
jgi:hypothetical protein